MADDALNPVIVDSVKETTNYVFGPKSQTEPATNTGTSIAYQKVAQAASLAVQDGVDYQRNVLSISTVAQGKALALMFATKQTDPYMEILLLAMVASIGAVVTNGLIDAVAAGVVAKFPKS